MAGNVWEWTRSEDRTAYAVPDPEASSESDAVVTRGGAWDSPLSFARCAFRFWFELDYRNDALGFRLVLCCPPVR
jgi:formylglycine-generating enzyme required for sulfatase activity